MDITLACGTGMAATLLVGHKVWGLESGASLVPPSGDRLRLWCEPIGDSALRVGFWAKNGDCCGEPAVITALGNSLDSPCKAPFLSPKSCREQVEPESLQSPIFISKILESQSSSESHKSHREQVEPERSPTSNTANPRILEKRKQAGREKSAQSLESTFSKVDSRGGDLSLRDTAEAVAWQSNSAPAESSQINGARKACNLESVVGGLGGKRSEKGGGIRGDASQVAPLSPLEKTLSQAKLESSNNAKKVESSMDSKETSANAERYPLFSKEAALCHASTTALARNDRKHTQNLESTFEKNEQATQKVDSRENAKNLTTPQARANLDSSKSPCDSKILDEKCGLQGKSQGSYLSGSDRRDFSPLPHFSLKAESPQVDSTSKLPTLAHINELESKAYSGDMEVFLEGQVRCVAVCQTCYD